MQKKGVGFSEFGVGFWVRSSGIHMMIVVLLVVGVAVLCNSGTAYAKARSHWIFDKHKNKVAFVRSDGSRVKGVKKIGKRVYFFDKEGRLVRGKERRLKWSGNWYDVRRNGTVRKGWQVFGEGLYYFGGKTGEMARNKTVDDIRLLASGKAYMDLNASIRYKCVKKLKAWGVQDKSRKAQLRRAWKYVSGHTFHYATIYPKMKDKRWTKKYADRMLSSHRGNCYGFACTFAAFASTIGYDPYVVCGRCRGGRDHARDGYTRHAFVKINGRCYDPEGQFAGWLRHVYGKKKYRYPFKKKFAVRFNRVDGRVKTKKASIPPGTLQKIDGVYYCFDKAGQSVKGVRLIGNKLYKFSQKEAFGYGMTTESYERWQAAAKEGKPFNPLSKLLGTPKRVVEAESCYRPDGVDRINYYSGFVVNTFVPDSGEGEIIIGIYTE